MSQRFITTVDTLTELKHLDRGYLCATIAGIINTALQQSENAFTETVDDYIIQAHNADNVISREEYNSVNGASALPEDGDLEDVYINPASGEISNREVIDWNNGHQVCAEYAPAVFPSVMEVMSTIRHRVTGLEVTKVNICSDCRTLVIDIE